MQLDEILMTPSLAVLKTEAEREAQLSAAAAISKKEEGVSNGNGVGSGAHDPDFPEIKLEDDEKDESYDIDIEKYRVTLMISALSQWRIFNKGQIVGSRFFPTVPRSFPQELDCFRFVDNHLDNHKNPSQINPPLKSDRLKIIPDENSSSSLVSPIPQRCT